MQRAVSRDHVLSLKRTRVSQDGLLSRVSGRWRVTKGRDKARLEEIRVALHAAKKAMESDSKTPGRVSLYSVSEGRIETLAKQVQEESTSIPTGIFEELYYFLKRIDYVPDERLNRPYVRFRDELSEHSYAKHSPIMTAGDLLTTDPLPYRVRDYPRPINTIRGSYLQALGLVVSILRHLGHDAYIGIAHTLPLSGGRGYLRRVIPILKNENEVIIFSPFHSIDKLNELHFIDDIGAYTLGRIQQFLVLNHELREQVRDTNSALLEAALRTCHANPLADMLSEGETRYPFSEYHVHLHLSDILDEKVGPWLVENRHLTQGQLDTARGRYHQTEAATAPFLKAGEAADLILEIDALWPSRNARIVDKFVGFSHLRTSVTRSAERMAHQLEHLNALLGDTTRQQEILANLRSRGLV